MPHKYSWIPASSMLNPYYPYLLKFQNQLSLQILRYLLVRSLVWDHDATNSFRGVKISSHLKSDKLVEISLVQALMEFVQFSLFIIATNFIHLWVFRWSHHPCTLEGGKHFLLRKRPRSNLVSIDFQKIWSFLIRCIADASFPCLTH